MFSFWKHNKKKKYITASELKSLIDNNEDIYIVDLRLSEDFADSGRIGNAINISVDILEKTCENILTDKSKKIVLYCDSGEKNDVAADILFSLGYEQVFIFGAIFNWKYDLNWKK